MPLYVAWYEDRTGRSAIGFATLNEAVDWVLDVADVRSNGMLDQDFLDSESICDPTDPSFSTSERLDSIHHMRRLQTAAYWGIDVIENPAG